jgi:hypothetical protein
VTVPGRLKDLLDPRVLLSRDRRLLHFFGECEPAGYGYLKHVLAVYSRFELDPQKRPVIRYRDYNRRSEYLFEPTRFVTDPSVLVGVGLHESDSKERRIREGSRAADGSWRLSVDTNIDMLSRIDVELEPGNSDTPRLRLYRRERDEIPAWISSTVSPDSNSGALRLQFPVTPPLQLTSRLVQPLVLRVDGTAAIRRISAFGVVLNLDRYRVVHRSGGCFTAVSVEHEGRWSQFIRDLGNLQ